MRKSFRYRLYPTPAQETALDFTLDQCRWLYNLLLEQRKTAWETEQIGLTLYDQQNTFPALKAERVSLTRVYSQVLQNVAVRLDLAFKAFFRRVKAGETPGYPRFRGRDRYNSFCYPQSGFSLEDHAVRLSKIGVVKAVLHRPIEGKIKTCCVSRSSTGKWFVCFSCEVSVDLTNTEAQPLPVSALAVGIDVGLKTFATLSTGDEIANPRFFRRDEQALAKAQRRLAKAEKGTPERRKRRKPVARIHERIANRRLDFTHQNARRIVNQFGVIAVEDLSVNRMLHNHCLAKSISDAAWSQFASVLSQKAECAARTYIAVNPSYTSQTCSACGHRQTMPLGERQFRCPCCALSLDRDHNASLNIKALGLQRLSASSRSPRL